MRLMEVLRLRVQDVDFAYRQVVVRVGKGDKDRVLPPPSRLESPLESQIAMTLQIHAADLEFGFGRVHLPHALARKYPSAETSEGWQYVFPARRRSIDPLTGITRRHHLDETVLQKSVLP